MLISGGGGIGDRLLLFGGVLVSFSTKASTLSRWFWMSVSRISVSRWFRSVASIGSLYLALYTGPGRSGYIGDVPG